MNTIKIFAVMILVIFGSLAASCAFEGDLKDGAYEGEYSFVKVLVTVEGGRVTGIEIMEHGGGGEYYAEMVEPLTDRMVAQQTTEVDAVTGATVSSNNLSNAVDDAISKASR